MPRMNLIMLKMLAFCLTLIFTSCVFFCFPFFFIVKLPTKTAAQIQIRAARPYLFTVIVKALA